MARRGLLPPLFTPTAGDPSSLRAAALRRALGGSVLVLILWVAVFSPLAALGLPQVIDPESLRIPQLFLVHGLLLAAMALWFGFGFVGSHRQEGARSLGPVHQFGLTTKHLAAEMSLGVAAGFAAWFLVLVLLVAVGAAIWFFGEEEALLKEAPAIVPWMASLPIAVRLAISASAGFFEELFFRGFLQPRVGVALSTALFVLAHASYAQPLMLLGITALSLVFAFLVKWRQNIWPAIVAHAVFNAIQLIFVIPTALEFIETQSELGAVVAGLLDSPV